MSDVQRREEEQFIVSTDSEWDRAEAYQVGSENQDRCWVLTDRDVWHRNPFFTGPEQPHPEDCYDDDEPPVPDPALPDTEIPF